ADCDGIGAVIAHQTLGRVGYLSECRANGAQVDLAFRGQLQALGVTDEQRDSDRLFKLGNLLADGCWSDEKLARRAFHAGVTPRRFKTQ
nr:hypothetical protein [Tanacetum cinerariifolium]